ncbi:uncharacterized protein LOC108672162 isoform X2 [Hyalella azteca]|uniref:Uncharacterized protein LOC108672162 isoform X2 n=1 Tax=Hyalella azteca TaxID=294128 RepID=A0A8B7NQ98_HYAAZ|nr:uncharacterized protein LOC108672162 isoform X2 [Hyalella azteca]
MRMYNKSGEKRRFDEMDGDDEEAIGTLCRLSGGHPTSPVCAMENEKRIRREIANSNERRRMKSINAGFASLKELLPNTDGEKLSKAAILQQTADYIYKLEKERQELMSQNNELKKILQQESLDGSSSEGESPVLTEILSTIQDLQNNPSACKLPNTEFHKLNNNSSSKNNNSIEKSLVPLDRNNRLSAAVCTKIDGKNVLVSRQTVRLHKNARQQDSEDRNCVGKEETQYFVEAPLHYVDVKTEQYTERRRRSNVDDSVKTLVHCSANKIKMGYGTDDEVKSEPCEYGPVSTLGFESCEAVPRTASIAVSANGNNGTVLHNTNTARCFTINAGSVHHPNSGHTGTTIVTILPPTPPHPTSMPSLPISLTTVSKVGTPVLEVVSNQGKGITQQRMVDEERCTIIPRVEVEPASRIPTPDEYSSGESPPHHQHQLQQEIHEGESIGPGIGSSNANSGNNQSCQKSLDTICEAIRHLEGDHMFSATDDHCQLNRIEEEIITEETFPIHDSTTGSLHDEPSFHSSNGGITGTIVRHVKDSIYEICPSPNNGQTTTFQQRIQFHPNTTMVYGLDEHLVASEPQEVPLELTTNNRFERIDSPPPTSISIQGNAFSSTNLIQASRPGVIVVKQA